TVRSRVGTAVGMTAPVGSRMRGEEGISTKAIVSGAPSSPTADTFTSACEGTSRDGKFGKLGPNGTSHRPVTIAGITGCGDGAIGGTTTAVTPIRPSEVVSTGTAAIFAASKRIKTARNHRIAPPETSACERVRVPDRKNYVVDALLLSTVVIWGFNCAIVKMT